MENANEEALRSDRSLFVSFRPPLSGYSKGRDAIVSFQVHLCTIQLFTLMRPPKGTSTGTKPPTGTGATPARFHEKERRIASRSMGRKDSFFLLSLSVKEYIRIASL